MAGCLGRMGREACAAISSAPDLELVGGFARTRSGDTLAHALGLAEGGRIYDDIGALYDAATPDVVVDFTVYPVSVEVAREAARRGISPVVGATGWTDEDEVSVAALCDARGIGAALVPNFAVGAVLMMRFAAEAARYFPTVEIIELHHDAKVDAPSGTAKLTARRIASARNVPGDVPIHSVRLRGLVAHQEVLLGGEGEVLTIRHDSLSRASFMSGVLLAVRGVRSRTGLVVGLEAFLGVPA